MKKISLVVLLVAVIAAGFLLTPANKLENPLPPGTTADKVLIEKGERRLTLFNKNAPLKSYKISLGKEPVGKKTEEGDGRTPEGIYSIDRRKFNSSYHRGLHISYPCPEDTAKAKERGVDPGGAIMIHGLPNGLGFIGKYHTKMDWTRGCIALTNPEIEEVWGAVPDGTKVEIVR